MKDSKGKRTENKEEAKKLNKIDFFSRYNLLKCVLRLFKNLEDNQLIVIIEVNVTPVQQDTHELSYSLWDYSALVMGDRF